MLDALRGLSPVSQALVATTGTYLLTAIGTLPVFFFRSAPRRVMDGMMGFAGGVMVAASCWSLLVPAIASGGVPAATTGLLAGGAFPHSITEALVEEQGVGLHRTRCQTPRVRLKDRASL